VPDNPISPVRMLLVSREPSALNCLWTLGQANDWQLDTADSGLQALERVRSGVVPHLVLLDLGPGDADGLHTLRWLHRVRPELPVILLSPPDDNGQMVEAIRLGAQDYVLKPCQAEQLERVLKRHLTDRMEEDYDGRSEDIESIGEESFFVSGGPAMRKLRARAELLAQVNVPVLILGESGSGKEVAARLIHKLSVRSGFRFLKAKCAALPGDLLERELFGHERGAFTGAMRVKRGKFELCHGGTILLDKITEMPTGLQAQLLHVLQHKQFFRLGSETPLEVDLRIMAATNMDIERALAEKKLREDLYYRLSAFTIHVPPLRQRKDEIPLLLGHFVNRIAKHYGLPPRPISANVLEACQQYSWPGNLRELKSFVKCYLVMGEESLTVSELMPKTNSPGLIIPTPERGPIEEPVRSLKSLVRSVKDETEKNAIAGALEETHWNRKAAARLLRVSYRALLYKIQQHHMTPPEYLSHSTASYGAKAKGTELIPLFPTIRPAKSELARSESSPVIPAVKT
jgi:two-component system, NtrC family, response regulator AtoC